VQRITMTIDDDLLAEIDRVAEARGYQNRSEAIRDLARAGLQHTAPQLDGSRDCVAALVYVYDHEARELSRRLTRTFHDHHAMTLATLHVHLDHDSCMEVNVLRGRSDEVQHFAEHVVAERGVRHGQVVMVASSEPKGGKAHHHHGPEKPRRKSGAPSKTPRTAAARRR
jgi:CopG family transcriptional regulator, nickel-responsive regulator